MLLSLNLLAFLVNFPFSLQEGLSAEFDSEGASFGGFPQSLNAPPVYKPRSSAFFNKQQVYNLYKLEIAPRAISAIALSLAFGK